LTACASAPNTPQNFAADNQAPKTVTASTHVPSKIVLAEVLSDIKSVNYPLPDAAKIGGSANATTLPHESTAAALWSGRRYFGRGKILDERSEEISLALLAAGGADAWRLENPKTDTERLVHVESGIECPTTVNMNLQKDDNEANKRYSLNGVTQYDKRGRDVSCNYASGGDAIITIYASFYPELSLEDHAAGAAAAIEQNFDIKRTLPISQVTLLNEVTTPNAEPVAPTIAGAFDVGVINGTPYKTALWLGKAYGWHVKARATYAQSDVSSEIVAVLLFSINYMNAHQKNAVNPTTSGPEV
jgi:hypothetical protein